MLKADPRKCPLSPRTPHPTARGCPRLLCRSPPRRVPRDQPVTETPRGQGGRGAPLPETQSLSGTPHPPLRGPSGMQALPEPAPSTPAVGGHGVQGGLGVPREGTGVRWWVEGSRRYLWQ